MPELSYGSHMFHDLVETEIFYTALFDNKKTLYFNKNYFSDEKNLLTDILPDCEDYKEIVHVYDVRSKNLRLYSDIQNKETLLGIES